VPAPGRRSLDAHEHEGRRTTERPIGHSRHAAAHRPPSNFHKILFTPGCSDLSLSLSLPLLFLSFSLPPYHRLLQPYNVRPDRARIRRVRDRIVLLPYLRKSALLRRAVLAYEPTRQPLPFASTTVRASSTLRRRPSPPSFLLGRPIVRETRIGSIGYPPFPTAIAIFQSRSNTLVGASCPQKIRENESESGKRRTTRLYFAPLTDPPIGKPDVACQVGTPASAMLIATPEVRIQADPRPKPLVPRPLPLSHTPIHIRRRPMSTTRTDPLSRFHRPRLLSFLTSPYRALLHAPAFSLRNTRILDFSISRISRTVARVIRANRSIYIDLPASRPRIFSASLSVPPLSDERAKFYDISPPSSSSSSSSSLFVVSPAQMSQQPRSSYESKTRRENAQPLTRSANSTNAREIRLNARRCFFHIDSDSMEIVATSRERRPRYRRAIHVRWRPPARWPERKLSRPYQRERPLPRKTVVP
jgi:hypothetical protein